MCHGRDIGYEQEAGVDQGRGAVDHGRDIDLVRGRNDKGRGSDCTKQTKQQPNNPHFVSFKISLTIIRVFHLPKISLTIIRVFYLPKISLTIIRVFHLPKIAIELMKFLIRIGINQARI